MERDLTTGSITKTMVLFAIPMILGNLLQQFYNVADTWVVGRFLGPNALAAVGSSYSLMTFLTSVVLGLCMGSGTVFSIFYGAENRDKMKNSMFVSFVLIFLVALSMNVAVILLRDQILVWMGVPEDVSGLMGEYLQVIFLGILFTFLYNYFAFLLRSIGNSVVPLVFLAVAAVLNVGLDFLFVMGLKRGVAGAAEATVLAQGFSGLGLAFYTLVKEKQLRLQKQHLFFSVAMMKEIAQASVLTCLQQSVMNFGILLVQGIINGFGMVVMAAHAAAVKIDSFAYMPVQDFGNAFSLFVAQNYGAKKKDRIRKAMVEAAKIAALFCVIISVGVCVLALPLMHFFIAPEETEIVAVGVQYLRIEGSFYLGIGCLFLLYGFYRAIKRPGMSLVLTVVSLGTRVVLAYVLSPMESIGTVGIWAAIPIGWFLADAVGIGYYLYCKKRKDLLDLA